MTAYTPPSIQSNSTAWENAPERYHLFTIVDESGKTVDYSMPRAKHPGMLLTYLQLARKQGEGMAASWVIEAAVGEAGYYALANEPDVDEVTINTIARAIVKVISGKADPVAIPDEPTAEMPEADSGSPF